MPQKITDWLSAIATVVAALVAAPAAVYAAIYTRRAADAAARAAAEAANQVKELRVLRTPSAVLKLRVPTFDVESYVKFGRGDHRYRSGPPIFLDVWNVSGPTIMVMEIAVRLDDAPDPEGLRMVPLAPQVLVKTGEVASTNVAYQLMHRASPAASGFIDFPDSTLVKACFTVKYFSLDGEETLQAQGAFQFRVTEEHIVSWVQS
jgi:hypothetical protein